MASLFVEMLTRIRMSISEFDQKTPTRVVVIIIVVVVVRVVVVVFGMLGS